MFPYQEKIQIPHDPENLGGAFSMGVVEIHALREGRGIASIFQLPRDIHWLERFDFVHIQVLKKSKTLKVIRKADSDDLKKYRVPLWIQCEEIPYCCERPMFFVGQIDDDILYAERPINAKKWWHDAASFYVFTCPQCLSVKTIGQQF